MLISSWFLAYRRSPLSRVRLSVCVRLYNVHLALSEHQLRVRVKGYKSLPDHLSQTSIDYDCLIGRRAFKFLFPSAKTSKTSSLSLSLSQT